MEQVYKNKTGKMIRRKAKQQASEKQRLAEVKAEIREKDRERVIFFRHIGEIADRYAWKGIHQDGNHARKKRPAGKIPAQPTAIIPSGNKEMVPFPAIWMKSLFKVSITILSSIEKMRTDSVKHSA